VREFILFMQGWNACQKACCVECYNPIPEAGYPICLPDDDERRVMMGEINDVH
jgi:hypothetical protein